MSKLKEQLNEIQKKLKAPKGQYNSFGKYHYRSCEDILEAVKAILTKGVIVTVSDDIVVLGEGSEARFYIKATASISLGDEVVSVTGFARESLTKKGMDDSQITGTASSYARKYALNGLFLIDDTKDADTDENTKLTKGATDSKTPPKVDKKVYKKEDKKPKKEDDKVDDKKPTGKSSTRRFGNNKGSKKNDGI